MNSSDKMIEVNKGKVTNSCVDNYSKVVVSETKQKGQCDETLAFTSDVNPSKCSASENINVTKNRATDATSNQGMNDKVQKPKVDSSAKSPIVKQAEEDDFNPFDDIDEDMLDDFQKDSIQSPGLVNKCGRDIDTEDKDSVSKPKRRRRRPNVNVIPDSSPDIMNHSSSFHACKSLCTICHDVHKSRYGMSKVKVPQSRNMTNELLLSICMKFPDVFNKEVNVTLDSSSISEMSPKIRNEKLCNKLMKTSSGESGEFQASEQRRKGLVDRKKKEKKAKRQKRKKYPIRSHGEKLNEKHYTEIPKEPMKLRQGKILQVKLEPESENDNTIPKNIPTCHFCTEKFVNEKNLTKHLKYTHK